MRILLPLMLILWSGAAFGVEYLLDFDKTCSTNGDHLSFGCEPAIDAQYVVFLDGGIWKARLAESGAVTASFNMLRDDENILILEAPTAFSGNRVLYIFKPNKRFKLIEVAYSDILENNEATVKQGTFVPMN